MAGLAGAVRYPLIAWGDAPNAFWDEESCEYEFQRYSSGPEPEQREVRRQRGPFISPPQASLWPDPSWHPPCLGDRPPAHLDPNLPHSALTTKMQSTKASQMPCSPPTSAKSPLGQNLPLALTVTSVSGHTLSNLPDICCRDPALGCQGQSQQGRLKMCTSVFSLPAWQKPSPRARNQMSSCQNPVPSFMETGDGF